MTQNPPLGYIASVPPESVKKIFTDYRVADKSVMVVKNAIQTYINSFISPYGVNRNFLTSSASPIGLQFVTELTYDEEMKTSPNLRKTYLARFFAENTGRLPSILLIDSGVEYVDAGISEITAVSMDKDGSWIGTVTQILIVNLAITVATLSEEDTDTLSTMIMMMFGPLAAVVNNYIIHEKGAKWEVRLPMSGLTIGQLSNVPIEGDTKTTVWSRAVEVKCDFETQIRLKQPPQTFILDREATIAEQTKVLPKFLNLTPNQMIPLGQAYTLFIENMQNNYRLAVSDPSVALVTQDPPYVIQPRGQGQALILVIDRNAKELPLTKSNQKSSTLVCDIPFQIIK